MVGSDHDPSSYKNMNINILHYFVSLRSFHVQLNAPIQYAFSMVLLILYLKWTISTVLMQFWGKICCLVPQRNHSELLLHSALVFLSGLYTDKGIKKKQMLNLPQKKIEVSKSL